LGESTYFLLFLFKLILSININHIGPKKNIIYIFSESQLCAEVFCIYLNSFNDIVVSGISTQVNEFDKIFKMLRIDIFLIISCNPIFVESILKKLEETNQSKNILVIANSAFIKKNLNNKESHHFQITSFDQKLEIVQEKINILTNSDKKKHIENKHNILNCITSREREILNLIKKGKKTKEIADELFLSVKTIENHRNNILKKTKFKSMITLINALYKMGFIDL
jgi:hypothetical protein